MVPTVSSKPSEYVSITISFISVPLTLPHSPLPFPPVVSPLNEFNVYGYK